MCIRDSLKAIRPAELGNTPSEQAAWFEAFRTGGSLDAARAAALLPARADTVSLYRRIRGGHVAAADLQPVFSAEGPQNTGKTLASLTALQELGLIEEQEGRWLPVPVTAKQDLASCLLYTSGLFTGSIAQLRRADSLEVCGHHRQ